MAKGKYARKRLLKQYRELPIKETLLSTRVVNSLEHAGFVTAADIIFCSDEKIKAVPGVGEKALVEICEFKEQAINTLKKGGQRNV